MTNKLVVFINRLTYQKLRKFYHISCTKLQLPPEPLTRGLPPPIPVLSALCPQLNLLNPPHPQKKILGTPLMLGIYSIWNVTPIFRYVPYPLLQLPKLTKNARQKLARIVLWHAFSKWRQSVLCRFRSTIYGFRSPWRHRRVAYCKEFVLYIATVRKGTSGNEQTKICIKSTAQPYIHETLQLQSTGFLKTPENKSQTHSC